MARKYNIAPNLLFRWRHDLGNGRTASASKPAFLAVALPRSLTQAGTDEGLASQPAGPGHLIEIELVGGRRLRVDGSIDGATLRR